VISIRHESAADIQAIHIVEAAAFAREAEAILVDALRALNQDFISLVAAEDDSVVGHISFSRVTIEGHGGVFSALAPLGVLPSHQRHRFGSMLVMAGVEECRQRGVDAVFVVGNPAYYSRFGFVPASELGVTCEFEVPADAFRARVVTRSRVPNGMLRYQRPFHRV
jgi:putative acetyltransferase